MENILIDNNKNNENLKNQISELLIKNNLMKFIFNKIYYIIQEKKEGELVLKNENIIFQNLLDAYFYYQSSSLSNEKNDTEYFKNFILTENINIKNINETILKKIADCEFLFYQEKPSSLLNKKFQKENLIYYNMHIGNFDNKDSIINIETSFLLNLLMCACLSNHFSENQQYLINNFKNQYFKSLILSSFKQILDDENQDVVFDEIEISIKKLFKKIYILVLTLEIFLFTFVYIDLLENKINEIKTEKLNNIQKEKYKENFIFNLEKIGLSYLEMIPNLMENFTFNEILLRYNRIINSINSNLFIMSFQKKLILKLFKVIFNNIKLNNKKKTNKIDINNNDNDFNKFIDFIYGLKKENEENRNNFNDFIKIILEKDDYELDNSGYEQDSEDDEFEVDDFSKIIKSEKEIKNTYKLIKLKFSLNNLKEIINCFVIFWDENNIIKLLFEN